MGETTTLSVSRETLERFNDRKAATGDGDIPELSADQFLTSLLDAWDENDQSIYGEAPEYDAPDADEIADAVVNALDLESRDGPDFDALAREVARQVDYAELASKVADELEGRMR